MNQHLTYVAMSRHKDSARFYVEQEKGLEHHRRNELEEMRRMPQEIPMHKPTIEI